MTDDIDEIAVERACKGDRSITLNRSEMTAAIELCKRRGHSGRETAELLGITDRTVFRVLSGETAEAHPRRGATVDSTKEKIANALRSENAPIRKAASKANAALATLDSLLADWDAKELARERVAELEKALAEARALLRGKPAVSAAAPGEHKLARAWAREHGIEVPAIGRVPGPVLEQWRKAAA